MEEIYKNIKDYEGLYQISNFGRVKSLKRKVKQSNGFEYEIKERVLKLSYHTNGYVGITLNKEGKKRFLVHRLVAEHFLENEGNLPQVNHKDLDKANNRVENLEWVTKSENQLHYYRNI